MPDQYYLVMNCLHTVKKWTIPPVDKVRLQIQLIHLLRILTETDLGDVNTRPACCSSSAFKEILELSTQIGQHKHNPLLINELIERLGSMLAALSVRSGKGAVSPFLTGSFLVR